MPTYRIHSFQGAYMGEWEGESLAHALCAMHQDAGYHRVRVVSGEIQFPDADTEVLCGGVDDWDIQEVLDVQGYIIEAQTRLADDTILDVSDWDTLGPALNIG